MSSNMPNMVGTASNAEYYANIVVEKALSRNLISTCTELATEAYDGEKKTEDLLDDAERRILELSDTKNHGDFASVGTVVEATLDKITKLYENKAGLTGLPTGIPQPGPHDVGFAAVRLDSGRCPAEYGQDGLYPEHRPERRRPPSIRRWPSFSLEMSQEQLVQRLLCQIAHIDSQKLRTASSTAMKNGRA